jgi:hypothetical protein
LTEKCGWLDLPERLITARREIRGRIVFTTSFGIEDQAITHAIFTTGLDIDVVTFDTDASFQRRSRSGAPSSGAMAVTSAAYRRTEIMWKGCSSGMA